MAASTTTKVLASPCFTSIDPVTRMPALPTRNRPGSSTSVHVELGHVAARDRRIAIGTELRDVVFGPVGDAEAAAEIDVIDPVPVGAQHANEFAQAVRMPRRMAAGR